MTGLLAAAARLDPQRRHDLAVNDALMRASAEDASQRLVESFCVQRQHSGVCPYTCPSDAAAAPKHQATRINP